jgi:hypothetical protein
MAEISLGVSSWSFMRSSADGEGCFGGLETGRGRGFVLFFADAMTVFADCALDTARPDGGGAFAGFLDLVR